MKYINKNEEPKSFTAWKKLENDDWKPTWGNFSKPQKTDVHNSLLQEQGHICCYCGRLINIDNSHIEHLQPRGGYGQLSLDYTNLLASCQKDTVPKEPLHCGKKKDKWYDKKLMVSPLDINCAEFFRYTEDGQILSTENPDKALAAQTTINKLDLNIDKLKKMRVGAIEAILEGLEDLTDDEREILLQRFSQSDGNGQNQEFCAAIVYILKQYI
ncbi:TIGR02646 family protein [Anabaena cylindrica FACHB-243]|uniref:TIGR02646 family protein n=1 Tax=Anabaena cylindrica (strain ATCC 27899 / PCC 7122) TaxID=272123 RepID=K9ZGK0_ANACC|nr:MULTISPECIES: retron system putative HNH endonuclease [Anabaena]AFZ58306.1 hypothetical protein Anacy_2882 [Anabaena cylindrica PCC 7122]MBD2416898.1 TIGR02646 family protein [Anabaena cylindrica FACHB-243]MBY5281909.1 TIGR02646 family protein [Anabaena sp. CCAP 1446/1C]MBY5308615.1 TIGR02646 family protein [Anabaena sp. CCAP 1446/1C]MCM2406430.1 TIGR02646 family protein [Anabaena sp. CCAP 1446/1C]